MSNEKVKILGFAGSLRKGSYNKALLKAAAELMPKNAELEIYELDDIPPFNQDLENDLLVKVKEFKEKNKEGRRYSDCDTRIQLFLFWGFEERIRLGFKTIWRQFS